MMAILNHEGARFYKKDAREFSVGNIDGNAIEQFLKYQKRVRYKLSRIVFHSKFGEILAFQISIHV
jgi:hypothetical protein